MSKTICGTDCGVCGMKESCAGCAATGGNPFGGGCVIAECCKSKGFSCCGECTEKPCGLKSKIIEQFNALGIEEIKTVTDLNALKGSFINLEYPLPGGGSVKICDDSRIYLGNQICKKDSGRCYGLAADEKHLMVCEYGDFGSDPELVVFKRLS